MFIKNHEMGKGALQYLLDKILERSVFTNRFKLMAEKISYLHLPQSVDIMSPDNMDTLGKEFGQLMEM